MSFFQQISFSNLNAFFEVVQSWDLEFRQLDRGQFKGTLLQYGFKKAQVGITAANRKFDQRGTAPDKLVSFAMLGPGSPPVIWRGVEVGHHKLMVYTARDEIDCASEPGFNVMTYSVSEKMLSQLGRNLGMFRLERSLKRNKIIPISSRSVRVLKDAIIGTNCNVGPNGAGIDTEPVRMALETTIPHLILKMVAETLDIQIRSPLTRKRKRALAAIEQYLNGPTPPTKVGELCQVAGVSERTLQYLFRQKYGITPKTYLKRVQLNRVHRALYRMNPRKINITDIANEWGFWHMGQFARDYRKLFGELPTTTKKLAGHQRAKIDEVIPS